MSLRNLFAISCLLVIGCSSSDESQVATVSPVDVHCNYIRKLTTDCSNLATQFHRAQDEASAAAAAQDIVEACSAVFSTMQDAKSLPELTIDQKQEFADTFCAEYKEATHESLRQIGSSADAAFARVPAAVGFVEVASTYQVLTRQIQLFLPTFKRLTRADSAP